MILAILAVTALGASASATTIPTHYEAGHFFATPTTKAGQTLRLLVDTGGGGTGGMYWLADKAAARLKLHTSSCSIHGYALTVAAAPVFAPGQGVPAGIGPCGGKLMVNPGPYDHDGQLGASYLGTRVWTFDYPGQQLRIEGSAWQPGPAAHSTPLGFQKNDAGAVVQYFPRIVVRVDGQPLDLLLDTGATAHPTAQGAKASGTATVDGMGVTSYITTSTLERWHKAHPDWTLVEQGDDLFAPRFVARLIRVPSLEIAGWSIGPVWFTERPDQAFHGKMAQIMDKPPEGAIGGNALDHFVMTVDYPHATAWFTCVRGCVAAKLDK